METDTDMEGEIFQYCLSITVQSEHLLDLIRQNGPVSHASPSPRSNVKLLCDEVGEISNICRNKATEDLDSAPVTTEGLWKAAPGLFRSCGTTLSRLTDIFSAGKVQVLSVQQDPQAQRDIDVSTEQCLEIVRKCKGKPLSNNVNSFVASGIAAGSISTDKSTQILSDTADIVQCIEIVVKTAQEILDDLNSPTSDTSSPKSSFDLSDSSDAGNVQLERFVLRVVPRMFTGNVASRTFQDELATLKRLRDRALSEYKASITAQGYSQAEQQLKIVLDHMARLPREEQRHLRIHDLNVKYVRSRLEQNKWDDAESRLGALKAMKAEPGAKPVILYSRYLLAKIYLHEERLEEAESLIEHMNDVYYSRPNRKENPAPRAWKILRERLVAARIRKGDMEELLHKALKDSNVSMVGLILKVGPSCGFKNSKPLFGALLEIIREETDIDYDAVKQVLDLDPSIVELELDRTTLLNAAIEKNDYELTQILLDFGADADHQGDDDYTPLLCAVEYASCRILELLLTRGAEAKRQIPVYHTALDEAVKRNKFDMVVKLTEDRPNLNATDYEGYTPLHSAVQHESLDIVRHLVTKSARKNVTLKDGQTPLHLAVRKRVIDENILQIIAYMAAAGSDIYQLDGNGKSSVEYALFHESEEVLPKVLGANKSIDDTIDDHVQRPLLRAVASGNVDKARRALEHGANPNKLKKDSFSPLVRAIRLSNSGMVDLLLNHEKMRVNNDNKSGENPIICAIRQKQLATVKLLLGKRASVLVEDGSGRPSLLFAIDQGDAQMVELLLAHGSPVDGKLSMQYEDLDTGTTALHYAVVCGKRDILEVLLRHRPSPSINAVNEATLTPYQLAHTKGLEDMKRLLADHGADTTPPRKQKRPIWQRNVKT